MPNNYHINLDFLYGLLHLFEPSSLVLHYQEKEGFFLILSFSHRLLILTIHRYPSHLRSTNHHHHFRAIKHLITIVETRNSLHFSYPNVRSPIYPNILQYPHLHSIDILNNSLLRGFSSPSPKKSHR
jgi:hypothetical protein